MVSIIGAGPAGSYLAYLLAEDGFSVDVYEEHNCIGLPVQCTGILSDYLERIMPADREFLVNTTQRTRIHAPDGTFIELDNKNYIIDRAKFDSFLANKAMAAGAKYHLGKRLVSVDIPAKKLHFQGHTEQYSILIGADGPSSAVAKSASMFGKRRFMTGLQARARMKNDNTVEFYPHIGTFAWIVPENPEIVRIGVASYKNPKDIFAGFARLREKDIIERQAGLIPVFDPMIKTENAGIYLLGDAATMVKATTGGGVVQGLLAAEALRKAIVKRKSYSYLWKKSIGRDLLVHFLLRRMMDRFSAKDWNSLVHAFGKKGMKEALGMESRDRPVSLVLRVLAKNPGLLLYGRRFF